jgi:hypothetical protein
MATPTRTRIAQSETEIQQNREPRADPLVGSEKGDVTDPESDDPAEEKPLERRPADRVGRQDEDEQPEDDRGNEQAHQIPPGTAEPHRDTLTRHGGEGKKEGGADRGDH